MFLDDDFLLSNEWSKKLFHGYAKNQPIIDYHCHLEAKNIYENNCFKNLTTIWLNDNGIGDHYKWRLMRANGIDESLISGNGADFEKFLAFVKTIEKAIGNPVYEWSHLELRRYFGIDLILNEENAETIWELANKLLNSDDFRPKALICKMNVKLIATTDDPVDELNYHKKLAEEESRFKVVPTFRPDKIFKIDSEEFTEYLVTINRKNRVACLEDIEEWLKERINYFHTYGCRLADHGLNQFIYEATTKEQVKRIVDKAIQKEKLSTRELNCYQTYLQLFLMDLYKQFDWTMQLHMNVFRDASSINKEVIGSDAGFDSVGDQAGLGKMILNLYEEAEKSNSVPKSIWYSSNSNDWLTLATLMGSFQGKQVQKIQLGCAWWFNDTYDGIRQQLTIFSQQSLLGNFVGMLTDSRSFLSYPRHEYFRRILCELIGEWVTTGRLPQDEKYLGKLISKLSYENAVEYFNF